MPFQGLPWTEFISCPVCFKLFNERQQRPISLGCGHTVCKSCIRSKLNDNRCPFDQIVLPSDVDKLPANFALMHLVGAAVPEQEKEAVKKVSDNPKSYEQARKCIEEMAVHLKPLAENTSDDDSSTCSEPIPNKGSQSTTSSGGNATANNNSKCVLSRPMQRKLISLIHCQLLEEEGRSRASRIARSLGERIVSELLVLQQYPHQLSANLWAAVRTRGCQFLGPAMQEEVLKLILLALEDGSFLSRKVLVLFVVQRLESRYPQASKTAIGHVVQLLYRASCFKVLKREEESSLMQLKEEFRQYESLRREHDSQIVQIAIEAGLRISPEQWSSLLYGDPAHKSHMQSIIDKHQSPQSFAQSISELMLTLQRSVDHSGLQKLQPQLEFLSNIDPSPDCPAPSWENLEAIMRSLNTVMTAFVDFLSNPDHRSRLETAPIQNTRYKTSMCRDFSARGTCPRGNTCTFAHSQEELERYRSRSRRNGSRGVAGLPEKTSSSLTPSENDQLRQVQFKSLGLSGKSKSVMDLMNPKQNPSLPSHDIAPLMNNMTPVPTKLITHQKVNVQSTGAMAPIDFRLSTKKLDPEKPPFIPPSSPHITPTRMTFSHPSLDASECPVNPLLVPPTCFHPHTSGSYPHSPQINTSRPSSPYPGSSALPPFSMQSFPSGTNVRYSAPQISNSPLVRCATPLSSSSVPFSTRPPVGPSFVDPAMTGVDPLYGSCVTSGDLSSHPGHYVLPYGVQGGTLEDLTQRKQEIISHFQDEQVLMDPGVASISSGGFTTGLAGLKTVLGNNKKTREAMPSHVSDMFVATRTTQSLDELMNDDMSQYPNRWSNGEDIGLPLTNDLQYELSSTRGPLPDSSTTNSISFSMAVATSTANIYDMAVNPKLYNSLEDLVVSSEAQNLPPSTSVGDSEFSRFVDALRYSISFPESHLCFPGDDGDESFIPFEHTSVSKFGPISRMSRVKLHNSAPVQVTADSFKQMTPVLAVTPMDRPVSTSIAVPSRFPTPSLMEGVDLTVKPTPSEIPSVWNKPPQMSYHNLAYTKKGSEDAMSHNEKLAYELQAIEYEISMKTGRDPEPVRKMIHEAVMASSQNTPGPRAMPYPPVIESIRCDNKKSSNGFVPMTESMKNMKSGERLVPQHMAAQCFMDEYNRSRQGGGKM